MALEVGRVREDQVRERGHLRLEGVGDHDEGDAVLAVLAPVVQHPPHLVHVHGRVPRHVRHEDEERVDGIGVAAPRVGDHVVHEPVHRERVLPGKRLVDADRPALVVHEEVVGLRGPAQRRAVEDGVGLHRERRGRRLRARRDGPREGGLVAEPARSVDGAQQRHQDRECADGVKPVRVRGEPAHGMEGDGVAGDGIVLLAPAVGPRDGQLDLLVARGDAHLVGEPADGLRRDARDAGGPVRRVVTHALLEELEGGAHLGAIVQAEASEQERIRALGVRHHGLARVAVPPELVLGVEAALLLRDLRAHEHAELVVRLVQVHQLPRIRVAHEELAVVEAQLDQLVHQREDQRAVGSGADRDPLVGDGRVAGADRVHRDEAPAVALELRDRHLERIGVVVLRGAQHDEQPGTLEVRAPELPEGPADGVDHPGGHVHRAEAPVRGVVGGAELAREEPGERLHLVAPREERELLRVRRADACQALGEKREGLFPAYRLEFARAPLGAALAAQRPGEPGRRVLLHDARGALRADHALVQRVVGVAVDVAHLAVLQVDADAAATGAHVASGLAHAGARARNLRGGGGPARLIAHDFPFCFRRTRAGL